MGTNLAKAKYKKLVKHKRNPRDDTKSFSKNTTRVQYKLKNGDEVHQSVLSGRHQVYRDGKPRGKEYWRTLVKY